MRSEWLKVVLLLSKIPRYTEIVQVRKIRPVTVITVGVHGVERAATER